MSKIEVDEIVAKKIIVKGDKYTIAVNGVAGGIWITKNGEDVPCAFMCLNESQPMVGVYGTVKNTQAVAAMSAFEGVGHVQIVKPGEMKML